MEGTSRMIVHLRWWRDDIAASAIRMASEDEARHAILERYRNAEFSDWTPVAPGINAFDMNADEQLFVWADRASRDQNADPVADLLRSD
jgi:hypothetical protein